MDSNIITIAIEDRNGTIQDVEVPTDVNLSLMEILKASDYEILATCGGMALCATCHVQIKEGGEHLPEPSDQELDMLDTLPDADDESRLACQLHLVNENNGLSIKIKGALQ
ncbi:2Fe-2S iron-sulfur cluster-binding protein [Sphingobacterium wenxiniae]|uniref:Ferredoxin, 2Fe-2S n=1 Tax=Sphingobacterium wenxiniae TaxID=683125 RepID=A0A1I6SXZ7_9SPHI|nr:2Fe-2S iron-sulfur cluster-binding protein [Sphingobacterium wenxiniae]SFS81841.1 ferredoxin, 2Fe-2S [Sphingobacterium wenxiniae]